MNNINIEYNELNKYKWNFAAMSGLILGLANVALIFIVDALNGHGSAAKWIGYLEFVVVCGGLYYYSKKYAVGRGRFGLTYSQSLGIQFFISLFASLLIGIATYLVMFIVSPEYYAELYKKVFEGMGDQGADSYSLFKKYYAEMKGMPMLVIFYSMVSTIIKWFFPALIIASMTKNTTDPMQGFRESMNQNNENQL